MHKQQLIAMYSQLSLSFPSGAIAMNTGITGTGRIWLDDVACTGSELSLFNCAASPLGTNNCVHAEDAEVTCQPGIKE